MQKEPDSHVEKSVEKAEPVRLRVRDEKLLQDMAFLDACSRETGRPEIHKQLMELREYLQNARFTVANSTVAKARW